MCARCALFSEVFCRNAEQDMPWKKLRLWVGFVLALGGTVQAHSGLCATPDANVQPAPQVVLWHNLAREQAQALRTQTLLFNAGRKVQVRVEDVTDFLASTLKAKLHGRLPEMILSTPDTLSLKKTLQLSQLQREFFQAEMSPKTLDLATQNNQLWGAPILQGNHLMLYYNKSIEPVPATNWQQMIDQKLALKSHGKDTILWDFFAPYFFLTFFCGISACQKDMFNNKSLPPAELTLQALKSYLELGKNLLPPGKCVFECAVNRFQRGEVAYFISGDWDFATLEKSLGENLGVASLPAFQGNPLGSFYTSYLLMFPGNSAAGKHKHTLQEYLRFLQSRPVQRKFAETGRIPVDAKVLQEMKKASSKARQAMLTQLENATLLPGGHRSMLFWSAIHKAFRLLNEGVVNESQAAHIVNQTLSLEHDF